MEGKKFLALILVLFSQTATLFPMASVAMVKREVRRRSQARPFFSSAQPSFSNEKIVSNSSLLARAADYTLEFRFDEKSTDHIMKPINDFISDKEVKKTLQFISKAKNSDLSLDFLKKNFTFLRWHCDQKGAKKNRVSSNHRWRQGGKQGLDEIKLTHYAVFSGKGSYFKRKGYDCALYKIKSKKFGESIRFKYTKQRVLRGLFEGQRFSKHVKPLVWVSRKTLEDALLQGSIITHMPDGKKRLFTVAQDNAIPWVSPTVKSLRDQGRYWYFREVVKDKNKINRRHRKQVSLNQVIFAGDVKRLGLGKTILIRYDDPCTRQKKILVGILADWGGAFENNLYQLDLFAGVRKSRKDFQERINHFPTTVEAYILKLKPDRLKKLSS